MAFLAPDGWASTAEIARRDISAVRDEALLNAATSDLEVVGPA
jgi:hypothetical protein